MFVRSNFFWQINVLDLKLLWNRIHIKPIWLYFVFHIEIISFMLWDMKVHSLNRLRFPINHNKLKRQSTICQNFSFVQQNDLISFPTKPEHFLWKNDQTHNVLSSTAFTCRQFDKCNSIRRLPSSCIPCNFPLHYRDLRIEYIRRCYFLLVGNIKLKVENLGAISSLSHLSLNLFVGKRSEPLQMSEVFFLLWVFIYFFHF